MHSCPECGLEHDGQAAVAEPAVIPVETGPNENDVKIAEIEAAASIEREKIWTDQRGLELAAEVEGMRGELSGMREVLDRLAPPIPEPEPVPVPVPVPEPIAEPEAVPAPEETPPKAERKSAPKRGFF